MTRTTRRQFVAWALTGLFTVVVVWVFHLIHLPSPLMLGAMFAALLAAILMSVRVRPDRWLVAPAQGVIGLLAAGPVARADPSVLASYAIPSLIAVAFTLALSFFAGWLISRSGDLDPVTAIMSTIAGGASAMTTLAEELGADARYVTVAQYLRVLIVCFSLPFLLPLFAGGSVGMADDKVVDLTPSSWQTWLVVLAIITIPGWLAARTPLPAPRLLAPLAVGIAVGEFSPELVESPGLLRAAAFLIIGWQAGGAFDRASLMINIKRIPKALLSIMILLTGCTLMAALLTAAHVGTMTETYLATTPGGLYVVLALAHDRGAGPVVTVMQVIRVIIMLVVTAYLPQIVKAIGRARASRCAK